MKWILSPVAFCHGAVFVLWGSIDHRSGYQYAQMFSAISDNKKLFFIFHFGRYYGITRMYPYALIILIN